MALSYIRLGRFEYKTFAPCGGGKFPKHITLLARLFTSAPINAYLCAVEKAW